MKFLKNISLYLHPLVLSFKCNLAQVKFSNHTMFNHVMIRTFLVGGM